MKEAALLAKAMPKEAIKITNDTFVYGWPNRTIRSGYTLVAEQKHHLKIK